MKRHSRVHSCATGGVFRALTGLALISTCAWAGPPFQTDDPLPIDFRHYELYTFGTSDGTRVERDTAAPAFEFNWGALPDVHLHIIAPLAGIFPPPSDIVEDPLFEDPFSIGVGPRHSLKNRSSVTLGELRDHPWFLACQYHPEFKSKPNFPHPLFKGFIAACLAHWS